MMYSLKQVLKQEPNVIREFVILLLGVLVMTGAIEMDEKVLAGIGVLVSSGLGLFYVRPLTVSKDALDKLE